MVMEVKALLLLYQLVLFFEDIGSGALKNLRYLFLHRWTGLHLIYNFRRLRRYFIIIGKRTEPTRFTLIEIVLRKHENQRSYSFITFYWARGSSNIFRRSSSQGKSKRYTLVTSHSLCLNTLLSERTAVYSHLYFKYHCLS